MKLMNMKMLAIVALLSVTGYSFGYDFSISNKLKQPMIVRIKVRGGGYQYNIVKRDKRVTFRFGRGDIGLCVESIHTASVDLTDRFKGNNQYKGKNMMEIYESGADIHNAGPAHDAFSALVEDYALTSVPIKMLPGDVYEATAKAATALTSGLDDLACKITQIALAASTGGASEVANQIAGMATADTRAAALARKDAAKKVAESKEDPAKKPEADQAVAEVKIKDKIVDLGKLELALSMGSASLIENDDPYGYIEKPVPAAIAAVEKQKALFDDATYTKVKGYLDKGLSLLAMTAIAEYKDKLEASTTKISIDDEAMVYGCSGCNININMDTDGAKAKGCSFGLSEIAGSIAELVGTSVCKNREYLLLPGKAGEDEIIAVTRKGE